MVMNISCKFEKASYNIFFIKVVTVKSLYTLWQLWQRNEAKSIVSTGCYPVDTTTFSKCNTFLVKSDLLNSENVRVAIAPLCNELQVCNFIML